jgi:hypothetical protein
VEILHGLKIQDVLLLDVDRDFYLRRSLGSLVGKVHAPIAWHIRREVRFVSPSFHCPY